jgi:hypothetical protein
VYVSPLHHDVAQLARRGLLVMQRKGDHPTWLVLACPCRCAELLHINLMKSVEPHWRVTSTNTGVTLDPSLDVQTCGSHFWIRDSEVHWE